VSIYIKKNANNSSSQDLLSSNHNLDKKKRLLYLFNDIIILAKPLSQEPNALEKGKLKLLEKRELSEVEVHDIQPEEGGGNIIKKYLFFFLFLITWNDIFNNNYLYNVYIINNL